MVKAVHKAIDRGITFFDTAPIYGLGRSEEVLGRTLGARRKDVIVATKVGLVWKKNGAFEKSADGSPANINREIDASLRRLKTDYIDLYQIHWPDANTPIEDTLLAIEKLRKSGKIRCIGCCNFSLALLQEAMKYGDVATIQVPYNLIDMEVEQDLLPFCRQSGMAVLAYSPIARGLLTGKYDEKTVFESDDHRSRTGDDYFSSERMLRNLEVVDRVQLVAQKLGRTPAQLALRWVLENPGITTAVFGAKSAAQVEENIAASLFDIPEEDLRFLNGG